MRKEEIFDNFVRLFPDYAKDVKKYKKLGSKMIGLETEKGERLSFLYMDENNWNFGTKPWRKKPTPLGKKDGTTIGFHSFAKPAKLGEVNELVSN